VQRIQRICEKQSCQISGIFFLKLPHLNYRFQQVTKI
jgi:hypothetical protein